MPISRKDVEHVAKLARLELTGSEIEQLTSELGQILGHAAKISELDTSEVEPTASAIVSINVWRSDEVGPELSAEEALANAPDREDDTFSVPKIV